MAISEMTSNSSPFIQKLQEILNDPVNNQIIFYNQEDKRLQISNKKELEIILPKYFRHGRFESFVRQLNWYGFYKINNKSLNCYSHPDLEKGHKLSSIKSRRKTSGNKGQKNKRVEQSVEELPQQSPTVQFSNQKLGFFVPFQNKIPSQPYYLDNQICIMDPNQNYLYRNLGGSCIVYYSF